MTSDAEMEEFVIRPAIGSHLEQMTVELSAIRQAAAVSKSNPNTAQTAIVRIFFLFDILRTRPVQLFMKESDSYNLNLNSTFFKHENEKVLKIRSSVSR